MVYGGETVGWRAKVSVVIPAYAPRYPVLREVLEALAVQQDAEPFEVLVGVDQPPPPWASRYAFARFFQVDHPSPAAKRNRGMEEATGEIILFLDDDVVPAPDVIRLHREGHERHPEENVLLLGEVIWPEKVRRTALGWWVEWGHVHFDYRRWKDGQKVPPYAFYAAHISGKLSYLLSARFDPGYTWLAYEDSDFGLHLPEPRILFWARARADHRKDLTWDDIVLQARAMGRMRPYFLTRNPRRRRRVEGLITRWRHVLRGLRHLDALARRCATHPRLLGPLYAPLFRLAFLGHFADGLRLALRPSPSGRQAVYPVPQQT